jgi:hypothetical protein
MKTWWLIVLVALVLVFALRIKSGPDPILPPPPPNIGFSCQVIGDNDGCHKFGKKAVRCPTGMKVVHAKAACNLERGSVTPAQLAAVPKDTIRVLRASDRPSEGFCYVGKCEPPAPPAIAWSPSLCRNLAQDAGNHAIENISKWTSVEVGCAEYDKNGGDCHIVGALYCE